MDNDDGRLVAAYRPHPLLAAVLLAGCVALAVLSFLPATDRTGRLLYGVGCVFVLAVAATDLLWTPRLAVTERGLRVRAPMHSGFVAWSEDPTLRVDSRIRFGRPQSTLELDLDDDLVIFSRRALNADPADVLAVIDSVRGAIR